MERLITFKNEKLYFIDQTRLPAEYVVDEYSDYKDVCDAIKILKVRGAPAIGVAAAYGVVVAAGQFIDECAIGKYKTELAKAIKELSETRPTAVNLFWALERMEKVIDDYSGESPEELRTRLYTEAEAIADEDFALGRKLGEKGAEIINHGSTIMTICNAGSLATSGIGSAMACVHVAQEKGLEPKVYSLETRPLLQGARLTTWELLQSKVDVTLITDSMAAAVMKLKTVDMVITGADRIAANGDSANKIGTYALSILAKHHGIPFYIAAPKSTFDFKLKSGDEIPIEERNSDELKYFNGKQIAPLAVKVFNPAFDVAPAENISGIITEAGIIYPPFTQNIQKTFN